MNHPISLSVIKDSLPDELAKQIVVEQLYVAKIGFLPFRTKQKLSEKNATPQVVSEMFKLLENSPYVMEIVYKLNPENWADDNVVLSVMYSNDDVLLLRDAGVNLRMSMPERKRQAYKGGPISFWSPEQFTIYFRGALYLVYAPVPEPITTNLGQIARDFLEETLDHCHSLTSIDSVHPTPLIDDVYIVKCQSNSSSIFGRAPLVKYVKNNLVVFVDNNIEDAVDMFMDSVDSPVMRFYEARVSHAYLDKEIVNFGKLRNSLGELLIKHSNIGSVMKFFSSTPNQIRRNLSEMHLSLQSISRLELKIQRNIEVALRDINEDYYLSNMYQVLKNQIDMGLKYDKDTALNIMNFASEETNTSSMIQITFVSALVGAIIGGLITIIFQLISR